MRRICRRRTSIELREGSADILDFKTGAPPTKKQVESGLSPQLTLTAAILRGGGHGVLEVGERVRGRAAAVVDRSYGVRVLRRDGLGVGAGLGDAGDAAAAVVAAVVDDLFGAAVDGAERVGERGRRKSLVEEGVAVAADLLAGLCCGKWCQVGVVHGVAGDLVAGVVQRFQVVPGEVLGITDGAGVDEEGGP